MYAILKQLPFINDLLVKTASPREGKAMMPGERADLNRRSSEPQSDALTN